MSLDLAIAHGQEWRRPYRGSRTFDPSCRRGTCPWCVRNDTISSARLRAKADDELAHDEYDHLLACFEDDYYLEVR